MKELRIIAIYFVSVLLGAVLLAPPLYWVGQAIGKQFNIGVFVSSGFERYFNRAVLIAAVVGLVPLVRALRIRDRRKLGLSAGEHPWRWLWVGLAVALGMVAIEAIILGMTGFYPWSGSMLPALPRILGTAVVVSLLEEALFRGVLQSLAMETFGRIAGWLVIAFFFALIHYVKPPAFAVSGPTIEWYSGFQLLPHLFWLFALFPAPTWAGLLNLFVVGLILGRAAWLTRGLMLPIGLHAGWILGLESAKKAMARSESHWPWISQDLLGGLLPFVLLLLTWGGLELWLRQKRVLQSGTDA